MYVGTKELLEVAKHLESFSANEEFQRSAVGRYYHSCFLILRDYCKDKYGVCELNESYYELYSLLKNSEDYVEKDMAAKFKELRYFRNNADYGVDFEFESISSSRNLSRDIINSIYQLSS